MVETVFFQKLRLLCAGANGEGKSTRVSGFYIKIGVLIFA